MIERKIFRSILSLAVLALALLLPGCGTQDTDSLPQQPTALSAPLGSDGGFTLSLEAGRNTAALSGTLEDGTVLAGQEVQLAHAPFLKDGALYIPLEEVITLLGGSFVLEGDTATAALAGHVAVYQAGQGTMTLDGQSCDLDTYSFGPTENPETPPPPILEDGVFSAPLGLGFLFCTTIDDIGGRAVLGPGLLSDTSLAGIDLPEGTTLEDIPLDLTPGPLAGSLPQYDLMARQYTHGDNLTVYVLEAMPGKQLEEAGDVCGVRTTDPAQATPRGLRVGDSLDRANFLYGCFEEVRPGLYWLRCGLGMTGTRSFYLEAEGDTITAISLYTRFWGPAQMVEPVQ
ncbi:MAG: hypothetical protein HFE99_08505 [Ruminiclostridium sp.]|jgi:hypothetical protein|nr:hypothetical protein [Ruminiclostridium sp.]